MTLNRETRPHVAAVVAASGAHLAPGMNSTDNVFYAFSDRNVRDKYANMRSQRVSTLYYFEG
jgi:hypothetical protein